MQTRTRTVQRRVIEEFRDRGHLQHSLQAAGITERTHRRWLKKYQGYANRFQRAKELFVERMEAEADKRAMEGWDEPVYQGGELVGYKRKYSDILLITRLKALAPDKYRERDQQVPAPVINVAIVNNNDLIDFVDERVATLNGEVKQVNGAPQQSNGSGA